MTNGEDNSKLVYAGNTIVSPSMPFIHRVNGLQHGEIINVRGFIHQRPKAFSISLISDLKSEDNAASDYAMRLHAKFDGRGAIVLNNTLSARWGPEEMKPGLPVQVGSPFECMILVHYDHFRIAFNGKHYSNFRHRFHYGSVRRITVEGDVTLQSVRVIPSPAGARTEVKGIPAFQGARPIPAPGETSPKPIVPAMPGGYNLWMPYKVEVPGGMTTGRVIYLCLVPDNTWTGRFSINLNCGTAAKCNIAFHLTALFDKQVVVRNSLVNGKWGQEETVQTHFPFAPGFTTDIVIWCEKTHYNISVNNLHFTAFQHRVKTMDQINVLQVTGDVRVVHVRIKP